jgi:hypothetical protein
VLTVTGIIVATKAIAFGLLAIMAVIFSLANSGRAAGRAAAERGAAARRRKPDAR